MFQNPADPVELDAEDPAVVAAIRAFDRSRGFQIDLSHLTLIGRCAACRATIDA